MTQPAEACDPCVRVLACASCCLGRLQPHVFVRMYPLPVCTAMASGRLTRTSATECGSMSIIRPVNWRRLMDGEAHSCTELPVAAMGRCRVCTRHLCCLCSALVHVQSIRGPETLPYQLGGWQALSKAQGSVESEDMLVGKWDICT